MQSECTAISPQFICSYAWKKPARRPALLERAHKPSARSGESYSTEAEHPSIPWKAYLTSREFQHMASDLAEAIFTAPLTPKFESADRPAALMLDAQALPGAASGPRRGLLAPVLPREAAAAAGAPDGLPIAA